jgi:hypothetical protein
MGGRRCRRAAWWCRLSRSFALPKCLKPARAKYSHGSRSLQCDFGRGCRDSKWSSSAGLIGVISASASRGFCRSVSLPWPMMAMMMCACRNRAVNSLYLLAILHNFASDRTERRKFAVTMICGGATLRSSALVKNGSRDYDLLPPLLKPVGLGFKPVLCESYRLIESTRFPKAGVTSLLTVM